MNPDCLRFRLYTHIQEYPFEQYCVMNNLMFEDYETKRFSIRFSKKDSNLTVNSRLERFALINGYIGLFSVEETETQRGQRVINGIGARRKKEQKRAEILN